MGDIFSPIKTDAGKQKYQDLFLQQQSEPASLSNPIKAQMERETSIPRTVQKTSEGSTQTLSEPRDPERPESDMVRFAQDKAAYRAEQVEKYQVDLSDEEYAVLSDRIASAEDPDSEAWKWATAIEYTRLYDIPVSEAYTNLEYLNRKTFGENTSFTPKTNAKAVVDAFSLGNSVVRRGALGLNKMIAETTNNPGELERFEKELSELDQEDAALQDSIPRPWYVDILKAGAQAAPFSAYTAGAALVGGVFAPLGATAGAFAASMSTAQGLQYLDLRKAGVQPELAKNLSAGSAALQSVVELGLGNSAEFVAKVGGVNTITANLFKRMYATKAWTRALKVIGNYGAELLGEASEEAIQSLIGDGTQALAAVLQDGGVDPISATEAAQKAWESAKGGFMGAILLGVPNLAINAGVEYSDAKKLKKTAETVQSKEAFIAETADSPVFEGMTEEARKDAQEKIWETAAGTREQIIAKEAQDIAELTDTATDEELVEGVDEGMPVNRGNPVRLETGRLYVQEGGSVVTNDDGSVTRTLKAGDPTRETSNNRYGYIKFREYDDRVVIEDLRTKSGYDGIRQDFFLEFAERVAGKDIQWDPAGKRAQALKETLISGNPRGVKAGLQYFASDMDAGTIRGRLKLESRIAEYLPKLDSSERAAAVALLEARASTKGIDLETYLETTFQGEGFSNAVNVIPDAAQAAGVQTGAVKGGVSFAKDVSGAVRALIYVTEKSDFSTYVHEMAHVFRQEMESTIQAEAEAAFGVKDGKWSRDDEERFAVGFEEYLREGKAPSEQLKNLFQKMAEFMYRIYNALANRVEVSPEIRAVYDQLLSGDTPLAETAKKLASQSTRPTAQPAASATTQNTTEGAESRDISLDDDNKARIVDQSPEIKTSAKETEGPEPTFQDKTQDALDEAGELYKTIPEDLFFQSAAVKKLLEQMTREELIELLHSSDSAAGLPNYRAYRRDIEQDGKWPVQVSLDADSLKWVNDNMGHSSGDFMLREIGEAIKHEAAGSGIRVYHKSGDEFLAQAHTVNEYMKFKIALDKRLNSVIIKSQDKELGVTIEKPGIFLSDGIDNKGDMDAADKNLEPEKSYREAHGERSGRGKVPPGVRVVYDTGRNLDDSETKLFFENRAEELKAQKELNKNPTNQFTPERTRELRKIIEDGGDILFQTEDNEESGTRDLRSYFPKVRGGWTKDKILKQLKQWGAKPKGTYNIAREITRFDTPEELLSHIFYHGTGGFIDGALRPSITFSDRQAEQLGGGGYGQKYWAISVSKSKRMAERFSGQSRSVAVYPVILAKEAKIKDMSDTIDDAADLEDHIEALWNEGIDAVLIGGGEEELAILNPKAISVYKENDRYQVFGGLKSENMNLEKATAIHAEAQEIVAAGRPEKDAPSLPRILFQTAYHGTPHIVDRFSTDKIGTGEGAQAFGWGLYFADNREVAEWYARELATGLRIDDKPFFVKGHKVGTTGNETVDDYLLANFFYPEEAVKNLEEDIQNIKKAGNGPEQYSDLEEARDVIKEMISSGRIKTDLSGHLYQVDIPEPDDFLDWDKPFNQQNEKIQKILIDYSREADSYFKEILAPFERNSTTGGVVYRALEKAFRSSEEASKRLLLLGIPGIKFSNGSTRNTSEKQQYNFVIFDDKDVSITEMLFQTEEELVKDAASFESWQEFMEYYEEGSWTRPEDAAVPENADAQWYQTIWEKARGIIPEESLSEAEVQEQIELDDRTPGSPQTMDALWLVEMKKPGKLEEFLKRINWILTQKNEFGPEDSSELESMENIERLKRRITTELRHGSWISNATRLGVGRNLTERARRTLITLMSHASRDYRALYADIMQDPEWEVALADTEAGKLASIADPEIDYTELTPEQRRKIAERIDNAALAQKLKTGELTLEEAERHITYLNSQLAENNQKIKALEKEEESFRAEVGADYRSISDWETRRLLETADDLQMARAAYESRSDKTSRMIERGLAITEKYRKESQQIKANYDSIFRKFSDLSRAMEISGAVRTAIARRESLFEARAENERLKGQIAANREARKIRTQLVKKTMRKIRWNTIDYEYGRKILAIQRKFSPALFKGLNRWIGTEGPYLREMYSRWKTDNAYRVQLDIKMGKKHGWGKAQKLLDKPYDSWTNKEREFMLSVLPKEDWIEELNLDALAKDREEALQMDEESKEFADLVASALPARIISRIEKRLFAEWTIEEMEELAAVIDDLYSSGKRQLQAKRDAVRFDSDLTRAKIQRALAGVSSDDSPAERDRKIAQFRELYGYSQHIKGSSADALSRGTFKARIMNKGFLDANVRRVARFLDGGKDGINTELLYNQEDVVFNIEHRKIRERQKRIAESMEKHGITLPELYEMKTFSDLMGDGEDKLLSVDELLFILKADLDEQSRRAVMFGNFLEKTEKDFTSDEKLLIGLAEPRYNTVLSVAQNLPDKFLRFADEIAADYSDQFERMNEASIAEFNKPVWRVQNYVPLLRLDSGGDKNENRVAEDLFALSTNRKQSGTDKGMTEKRVDIPANWQSPVQLGLYSTWIDSVKRTEHFIAYAPYIRELNRVYKSNDANNLRGWMENRYGNGILKYIDGYINELANPDALGEQTKIDRLVKTMRGKTAPAYLAWKTSGILKQFITSPAPYFAHVNPAEYAAAAFDLALHPQLISETIREKSVFMDSRVMDPIMDLIKEQQLKSSNKVAAAWNEFSTLGMKGLEFADWACVAPGWLAVYRKELAKLEKDNVGVVEREISRLQEENDKAALELQKTDAEIRSLAEKKVLSAQEIERRSVKAADDATRLCQPSSRLSDLAPLFKIRGANTEVWKMLTQFQTSLNVIWQNIRYDLPNAVREKQWEQVVGMVSGYVVAGMAVNLFTQGLSKGDDDDDTEKVKQLVYYATTQFTDAVPLVGDLVTAQTKKMITGSSGYFGSDDFYPALSKLFQGVAAVTDGDWQRSALRFTEGVGYVFGAPVSGAKEAGRVLGIGDGDGELHLNPEALAGRR